MVYEKCIITIKAGGDALQKKLFYLPLPPPNIRGDNLSQRFTCFYPLLR